MSYPDFNYDRTGKPVVCIAHGCFVPCRRDGAHHVSSRRAWVEAVTRYQANPDPDVVWDRRPIPGLVDPKEEGV